MKKNDMLNESTIRRFMKLATIDGLSDKFVDEKLQEADEKELEERGMKMPKRDDEEMREGEEDLEEMRDKRDDDEMREGAHEDDEDVKEGKHKDDEDVKEGKHKDDEDVKEGKHKDDDEMRESDVDEMRGGLQMDRDDEPAAGGMVSVDQLMSALEKALEDVLGQEVEVSQDDDEMEMDMDLDADAEAGEEMDLDMDAADDDDDDELEEVNDDVIEEVFARVIQRLTKETKSNK